MTLQIQKEGAESLCMEEEEGQMKQTHYVYDTNENVTTLTTSNFIDHDLDQFILFSQKNLFQNYILFLMIKKMIKL